MIGENLLIEPIELEVTTDSGIIIGIDKHSKHMRSIHPQSGYIRQISNKAKELYPELKVGLEAFYKRFGSTAVEVEGKEHLIVPARDIDLVVGVKG